MARILVIDDEPLIREMLRVRLGRAGHEVVQAPNGIDALAIIKNDPVELVVTDIMMPEMDGLEMIMKLRRSNPGLKVIAVSGGSRIGNADFLQMASYLGASEVFYKPFDFPQLIAAIDKCLQPAPKP